jgi:hypothetical protein
MRSRKMILLSAVLAALALGSVASASASATEWHFGGTTLPELEGETVVGAAFSSSLKAAGASTTCQHFLYNMEVWNYWGVGEALLNELPLFECSTTAPSCKVTSMEAQELPWFAYVFSIGTKKYLEIEDVDVKIVYGGTGCSLGTKYLEGDAGGLINNTNSTATFSKSSFEATGSALFLAGTEVEWTGEFPMEAFQASREKAVEAY